MSATTTHDDPPATAAGEHGADHAPTTVIGPPADGASLVEEDLLVEDVSIDGMCGVY